MTLSNELLSPCRHLGPGYPAHHSRLPRSVPLLLRPLGPATSRPDRPGFPLLLQPPTTLLSTREDRSCLKNIHFAGQATTPADTHVPPRPWRWPCILAPPGLSETSASFSSIPRAADTSHQHPELPWSLRIRRTPSGPSGRSCFSLPSPQSRSLLNWPWLPRKRLSRATSSFHVASLHGHFARASLT